jgi:hypothetical protein
MIFSVNVPQFDAKSYHIETTKCSQGSPSKTEQIRQTAGPCTKVSQPHIVNSPAQMLFRTIQSDTLNRTSFFNQSLASENFDEEKKKKSSTKRDERHSNRQLTTSAYLFRLLFNPSFADRIKTRKLNFIKSQTCPSEAVVVVVVVEELVASEVDVEEVSSRGTWARLRRF